MVSISDFGIGKIAKIMGLPGILPRCFDFKIRSENKDAIISEPGMEVLKAENNQIGWQNDLTGIVQLPKLPFGLFCANSKESEITIRGNFAAPTSLATHFQARLQPSAFPSSSPRDALARERESL